MITRRFPFLPLALGALAGAVSARPPVFHTEVPLADGPKLVRVVCSGSAPTACRRILHAARVALPVLEEVLGVPLPERDDVPIHVFPEKGAWTMNEVGFLNHEDDRLQLWQGIEDWVVVHELAHLWLRAERFREMMGRERWIAEGLCHWAALEVCRRRPELGDPTWIHHALVDEAWRGADGWDEPLSSWSPPVPVVEETRRQGLAYYGKAYAFFSAAGRSTVSSLTRSMLSREEKATTGWVLEELARRAPRLKKAGAGWVLPGRKDEDLRPRPPEAWRTWESFDEKTLPPFPGLRSPEIPAATDLLDLRVRLAPRAIQVYLKVRGRFDTPGVTWSLGIDLDGDETFDRGIGFRSTGYPWTNHVHGAFELSDFHAWRGAHLLRRGSEAWLVLPRGALSWKGRPRIFAYTLQGTPPKRVDGLGWVTP